MLNLIFEYVKPASFLRNNQILTQPKHMRSYILPLKVLLAIPAKVES